MRIDLLAVVVWAMSSGPPIESGEMAAIPKIDRAMYERIKIGMPAEEAEAIVGLPAGYRSHKKRGWQSIESTFALMGCLDGKIKEWHSDEGSLVLSVDRRGRVEGKIIGIWKWPGD